MGDYFSKLFDTSDFPARWHCGDWSEFHGFLHIGSDLAIFGAYMGIPIALITFLWRRKDLPKPIPLIFWLFGAFIVVCGITHLNEAIIFWHPIYRAAGLVKLATAGVSWLTLAFMIPALPHALALQTPRSLERRVEEVTVALRRERDASAHLAAIVESSHDAIISVDGDGAIVSWNPGAMRLFGYGADDALGQRLDLLMPGRGDKLMLAGSQGDVAEFEEVQRRSDGSSFPAALTLSPLLGESGERRGASLIIRDITATRNAEVLFQRAVEASPSGMVAVDAEGAIVLLNSEAERIFGYEHNELLGEPIETLVPEGSRAAHPGFRRDFVLRGAERRVMGQGRELTARRKDGRTFPIEVGLNPIEVGGEQVILSAIVDRTEMRRRQDALEEKTAELERSNADLEHFAYMASHDLQEPLRMVVTFMGMLEGQYANRLDDKAKTYIGFASDGAKRMKQMVDGLLGYSRVDIRGRTFEWVSTRTLLENVRASLQLRIRELNATVQETGDLPTVRGDARQLEQVFQNLIANALKFCSSDVPPSIEISCEERAEHWLFSVSDHGVGFDGAQSGRLFQLFQRLHERSEFAGNGIGLALCKRILVRHGGEIWAEAEVGVGATFYFTLPKNLEASE